MSFLSAFFVFWRWRGFWRWEGMFFFLIFFLSPIFLWAKESKISFQGERMDLVFLIDSSSSMKHNDPRKFRTTAVKAFLDITQDRGGDRVAIYQFAGWHETVLDRARVLPLTEVPFEKKARLRFLENVRKKIDTHIQPFGRATDFNCAFSKCLQEVFQRRGEYSDRKLWVILITDGAMDVSRDREVFAGYLDYLKGGGRGASDPVQLNRAAKRYFRQKVLPSLQKKSVYITPILLANSGFKSEILELLALRTQGPSIPFQVSQAKLKSVFLQTLTSPPGNIYRPHFTAATHYNKLRLNPYGRLKSPLSFYVYEGSKVAKVLVFGPHKNFGVDIQDGKGVSYLPLPQTTILGKGEIYRVISLENLPAGEYFLQIYNQGTTAGDFETLIYYQFEFELHMKLINFKMPLYPAEEVVLEVGLRAPQPGKGFRYVRDKRFLKDLFGEISISPLEGSFRGFNTFKVDFSSYSEAKSVVKVPIPLQAPPGRYRIRFFCYGLPLDVKKFAYRSPPRYQVIELAKRLALEVWFERSEVFVGEKVRLQARLISKRLPPRLPLVPLTLFHKDGLKAELILTPEKKGGWRAVFSPSQDGLWRLREERFRPMLVFPQKGKDELRVLSRQLRVQQREGEGGLRSAPFQLLLKSSGVPPLHERLLADLGLFSPPQGRRVVFTLPLRLEAILPRGERAKVEFSLDPSDGFTFQVVEGGEDLSLPLFLTAQKRDLVLQLQAPSSWGGGKVDLEVIFQTEQGKEVFRFPLESDYRPPLSTLWVWGGICILILVGVGCWIFFAPKFREQVLYPLHIHEPGKVSYSLWSLRRGLRGNLAVGFPDTPPVAKFRLKRGGRVYVADISGKKLFSFSAPLSDGEVISFELDGVPYCYLFFHRPPSEEELERLVEAHDPGIYLAEDEWVLVDEFPSEGRGVE
ncbi:MAG: VWA domain-containing protein [Planctomycetota bacterium]|nr:MAG: VWA domain-containing protein [Planctomycetota bacterium]